MKIKDIYLGIVIAEVSEDTDKNEYCKSRGLNPDLFITE